ncbi:MAG: putative molybdenum carrier protein [Bacteroidales bacterium]|nr:putative molybdenum carrier protein [Bacteroidales bacterium]
MIKPKIISGGQTGVDQGALDFALDYNFDCGGFCPKGRLCEMGIIPFKYPLIEIDSEDFVERTRKNVLESDASIIVKDESEFKDGTLNAIMFCKQFSKPYLIYDVNFDPINYEMFQEWLNKNKIKVLNIAGNRASRSPGIKGKAYLLLEKLFNLSGK